MSSLSGLQKLTSKLREMAAKAQREGDASVLVGYSAAYALWVHEDVEMKWKGYSRDPRIRRVEMGGDPADARPRPREHEPKGRFWDPQEAAQAKFLETPARSEQPEMQRIIMQALHQGKTLAQALLLAGLHLQAASQKLCPVDTGNLRASAFTRLE